MNFQEFINYKPKCIFCNKPNVAAAFGTIDEKIEESSIISLCTYFAPIVRKNFITFPSGTFHSVSGSPGIDPATLNKNKYNSFSILNNNVVFDIDFHFKMRISFKVFCLDNHYSYNSRIIKITDKSNDITKGYNVAAETINYDKYSITFNKIKNKLSIDSCNGEDPRVIPYIDIESFPTDSSEKLLKKIENILLLS